MGEPMSLIARVLIEDQDRTDNQCLVYMNDRTFTVAVDGYIILHLTSIDGASVIQALRNQESCDIPIWKDHKKYSIESVTDVLTRARMAELIHEGIKYTTLHTIVTLN